jgi:hypothetical protein
VWLRGASYSMTGSHTPSYRRLLPLLPQVGEAVLHLAAEATFTTGVEYLVTGGAELGYGIQA